MSGCAMMFLQYPNLLAVQRKMKQRRHQGNLETIFGVREVPSDTQMRDIRDGVPVELIRPLLPAFFEKIRRAGWANAFTTTVRTGADQGPYDTLMLDGSDYFHSTRLQCPSCLQRHDSSGSETEMAKPNRTVRSTRPSASSRDCVMSTRSWR